MKITTLKDLKERMSKEEYEEAGKEALRDLAVGKAKELYGDIVDNRIVDRLRGEVEELSKCCELDTIFDVIEVIQYRKEHGDLCLSRLSHSNSLLFYLIGIGSVNPLPRHTFCPKCHSFNWGDKKTNKCECCGEPLIEDGYDLPFELLLDEIQRSGLRFDFSSTKDSKHVTVPIRYFSNSLIKLAKELGLTQKDIEKNDLEFAVVNEVIRCLLLPFDENEQSHYSKKYKKLFICEHTPFIGMPDLSSEVLKDVMNTYFEGFLSFDDLVKGIAMIHGTGVITANDRYVCDYLISSLLEDAIATRDELYQFLIKSQLSKDDALLICRETRLCGSGHLSLLSAAKLREAGVEEEYISFMRSISYIFHKGHTVAHARLAIKLANIYLEEPLRYYKAYFTVNKEKLLKMDKNYDFLKGLSESKSTDMEEVYLAAIDLIERGYDPKQLIAEVLND